MIVEGLKNIEVRSTSTKDMQKIAIYATKNSVKIPYNLEVDIFNLSWYPENKKCDSLIKRLNNNPVNGSIIGTVKISSGFKVDNIEMYRKYSHHHLAPESYFRKDKTYFWALQKPVRFSKPIPYKPPKGAVVWSKTTLPEGY